ncbi:MAG: hypothetical protein JXX14_05640 [Deltaproteobacteria bacterium]|nr:hypothetical protein [Deltaproteobacteria bacterium]
MFTLQRRKVKDKLDVLGKQLTSDFQDAGLELVMHLSDDHPSLWNNKKVDTQWLFFSRDTNAQRELSEIIDTEKTLAATLVDPTPLYRHIFLGVSMNETALEVGIRLHHDAWVDRKNLLAILTSPDKCTGFLNICRGLPTHIGFGLHQNDLSQVNTLDDAAIQAFQEEFDTSSKGWMFFGARFSREDVTEKGGVIQDAVRDTMKQLVAVYQYIAWSPQNDALSIDTIVEQKKQARQATHEELLQEQKAREEKQRQLVAEQQRQQEEKKQELLDEQAWREQERAKRRAAAIARREKEAQLQSEAPAPRPSAAPVAQTDAAGEPDGNQAPPAPPRQGRETDDSASGLRRQERAVPHRASDNRAKDNRASDNRASDNRGRNDARSSQSKSRFKDRDRGSNDTGRNNKSKSLRAPKPSAPTAPRPANVSEERKADIQVGDRIVVMDGFLKDRDGVVQSIDEKGDLKVSFGMLSSRVNRQDVKGLGPAV